MAFDKSLWTKTRHHSCNGSGVGKAVDEWNKSCPDDLNKVDDVDWALNACGRMEVALKLASKNLKKPGKLSLSSEKKKISATSSLINKWGAIVKAYRTKLNSLADATEKLVDTYIAKRLAFLDTLKKRRSDLQRVESECTAALNKALDAHSRIIGAGADMPTKTKERYFKRAKENAALADQILVEMTKSQATFKRVDFEEHRAEAVLWKKMGIRSVVAKKAVAKKDKGNFSTMTKRLAKLEESMTNLRATASRAKTAAAGAEAALMDASDRVSRVQVAVDRVVAENEKAISGFTTMVATSGVNANIRDPADAELRSKKMAGTIRRTRAFAKAIQDRAATLHRILDPKDSSNPDLKNSIGTLEAQLGKFKQMSSDFEKKLVGFEKRVKVAAKAGN